MPQTKKLAWAQLRVGVMAVAAIAILVVLIFLITGRGGLFRRTVQIRTFVDDSASLKEGAPVRLNGIDIGNVREVRLSGVSDPRRTIEIVMSIRREYRARIPVDSQAAINPEGVFGDKYVNITHGQSPNPVAAGGEIRSLDTKEFQEIVNQSYNVLASLNGITKRIDSIMSQVEKGGGTIGRLIYDDALYKRFDSVVGQAENIMASVSSGKGTIGKLLADEQLYDQASSTIRRVDTMVADVQAGKGTLGMLLNDPALYQNANGMLVDSRKVVDNLNAGQGTVGKLLKDDALYQQARGALTKVDTTVDRLNSGQGSLGQMLVNRALYDAVSGLSVDTQQLIRDIRANPKKFLRIKLAIF